MPRRRPRRRPTRRHYGSRRRSDRSGRSLTRAGSQSTIIASSSAPAASQQAGSVARETRGFASHQASDLVVEPGCGSRASTSRLRVADERRVPGQRIGHCEHFLEARLEVDGDHDPSEERTDGIRAGIQALRVSTPSQEGSRRGERGDDDVVDRRGIEVSAECQVLVRYVEPVNEADEAPGEVPRTWASGRRG